MVGIETLDPHRDARDAGSAEGAETGGIHGAGIGLQSDLRIRFKGQQGAHRIEQACQGVWREQAGRATTNEHGVHAAAPDSGQSRLQIGKEGIHIGLLRNAFIAYRV